MEWWDLSPVPFQKKGALREGAGRGALRAPGPAGLPGCALARRARNSSRSLRGAWHWAHTSLQAAGQEQEQQLSPTVSPSMGPRGSASAPWRSNRALSCYPACLSWKRNCQSKELHTSPARGGGEANSIFSLSFQGLGNKLWICWVVAFCSFFQSHPDDRTRNTFNMGFRCS